MTGPPRLARGRRSLATWLRDLVPLELELTIAGYRRGERLVPFLTALTLALAVALAAALEMSLRTMDEAITRSAQAIAGRADLEILAGGIQLREELIEEVRTVPGVEDAQGILIRTFRLANEPHTGEPLHVIGVDLARPKAMHGYEIERNQVVVGDPLKLLSIPGAVVISEALAKRLGAEIGDKVPVTSALGSHALRAEGVVTGTLSDAFAGIVAVTDIYSLQELTGRLGWIDRIDVSVSEGTNVDLVAEELKDLVAGTAHVARAASHTRWTTSLLAALETTLRAIVGTGAAVAVLIAYGTMNRRAVRRRREFAVMRSSGLERRAIGRIVALDALFLGCGAVVLGLPIAFATAPMIVSGLANLPTLAGHLDSSRTGPNHTTILVAFVVGPGLALAGSLLPALRITRHLPLDSLPEWASRRTPGEGFRLVWLAGGFCVALGAVAFAPGLEVARAGLVLLAGASLVGAGVQRSLPVLLEALRPLWEATVPRLGSIVGSTLIARPTELALATTTIMAVMGAALGISVVITSMNEAVMSALLRHLDGAIYIGAKPPGSGVEEDLISKQTVELIREAPGVTAISEQYITEIVYRGEEVQLLLFGLSSEQARARLSPLQGMPSEVAREMAEGAVAVSPEFARRFRVGIGDEIELPSALGARTFRVSSVLVQDFGGINGALFLDTSVADGYWPRPGAHGVRVWGNTEEKILAAAILARTRGREPLYLYFGDVLVETARGNLRRISSTLQMIGLSIGSIGGLAILTTLLGAVVDRQREHALLMAVGLSRLQVAVVVALDGVLAASIGVALATLLGLVIVPVFAATVRDVIGWTFEAKIRGPEVFSLAIAALGAAVALGLYPSLAASRASTQTLVGD